MRPQAGPLVQFFIDYKSPYAYLAVEPAYRLEAETGVAFDWQPYTLDIPAYLGDATVDADGRILEENRNEHQWRRVKYSYMDCRREANRRATVERFAELIAGALEEEEPRVRTRTPRVQRKRRLESKRRRSQKKALRSPPDEND